VGEGRSLEPWEGVNSRRRKGGVRLINRVEKKSPKQVGGTFEKKRGGGKRRLKRGGTLVFYVGKKESMGPAIVPGCHLQNYWNVRKKKKNLPRGGTKRKRIKNRT